MLSRATKLVAISIDGELHVHAAGMGGYASLCGLDGGADGDTSCGQRPVALPKRAKINCPACIALWKAWRAIKPGDFARGVLDE